MKFQDWFDSRLKEYDSIEELQDSNMHYIVTDLFTLKKTYNAYKHTGLLNTEYVELGQIKDDENELYFFMVYDKYINFDSIFQYIKDIRGLNLVDELSKYNYKEALKDCFMFVMSLDGSDKELDENKEYYFYISLNPNNYNIKYINEIDNIFNKCIPDYKVSIEHIETLIMSLLKDDKIFKYTFGTNWENVGVIAFETKEDLDYYLEHREKIFNKTNISISKEDLDFLIKNATHYSEYEPQVHFNNKNNNGNEPLLN